MFVYIKIISPIGLSYRSEYTYIIVSIRHVLAFGNRQNMYEKLRFYIVIIL